MKKKLSAMMEKIIFTIIAHQSSLKMIKNMFIIAQIKTGVVLLIISAIEAVKLKIINYIIQKNN